MPRPFDRHFVDEEFRRALEHHKVKPSAGGWNRLAQKLSDEKKPNRRFFFFSIAASVTLLIVAGSFFFNNKTSIPVATDNTQKMIIAPNENVNASVPENISLTENNSPIVAEAVIQNITTASTDLITNKNDFTLLNVISNHSTNLSIQPTQATSITLENKLPTVSANIGKEVFYTGNSNSNQDQKNFYLGFGQAISSTWLFNSATFANAALTNHPSFGPSFAVTTGFDLSKRWALNSGVSYSNEGQEYSYHSVYGRVSNPEPTDRNITLNYLRLPVMVRYKSNQYSGITRNGMVINYSLGMQYGRLINSTVTSTGSDAASSSSLFLDNEMSLCGGVDYDFISRKSMFFTVGLHGSYGSNVLQQSSNLEFAKAHNFQVGLHSALNFSLSKERK